MSQFIAGPSGKIEYELEQPLEAKHNAIAIICHPHPLFGGSMTNKVVTTVAKAFREQNIPTIRFNFRGIGASEGVYASAIGEGDDLIAVANFAKQQYSNAQLHLAGFSFGSFIATSKAKILAAASLITVAPPVNHFHFTDLNLPSCPWLVIQGTADDVVPADEVFAWFKPLANAIDMQVINDAGHYFHGRLLELKDQVKKFLEHGGF